MAMTLPETSDVNQTPRAGLFMDRPVRRKQKLTAPLDRHRSVVTLGIDSTMDAYFKSIRELMRRCAAAQKQGIELPTFLRILDDQAGR